MHGRLIKFIASITLKHFNFATKRFSTRTLKLQKIL